METITKQIIKCFKNGNKVLLIGNGGSAEMCSHFAAELVNKMSSYRKALPAISLTSDIAVITSIANDMGFEYIFSRQIEAVGQRGDILIALSTSGKSKNILMAIKTAKKLGLKVISFPTNRELGTPTPTTQELHLQQIHDISQEIENAYL